MAMVLYQSNDAKKPTKLVPEVNALKDDIAQQCKLVELLAQSGNADIMSKKTFVSIDQLRATIDHLSREKAPKAVVFLCTELNRSWKKEQLKCAPVDWFPKGYSLRTPTMRKLTEQMHNMCHEANIHVPLVTSNATKHALNIIYAKLTWPEIYKQWKKHGPSQTHLTSNAECLIQNWFCQPEYSDRSERFEVRCIDATHLLTRTRRKSCR
ncbi:hypothetical protein MAR_036110 [Mya arenaria]|uniref:Transposase n=1 Tax=Mya arenaria TaxID=6604 RepID=A0ABY7EQ09_MYAAR|nr:hypothetical protein MAR_036110 [Mya arenaria]